MQLSQKSTEQLEARFAEREKVARRASQCGVRAVEGKVCGEEKCDFLSWQTLRMCRLN